MILSLRTGVLTKPDRIEDGDHEPWLAIASNRNRAWKLTHGWYVTKQCNTKELDQNLPFEQVRDNERLFFENEEPWKGLDQDRFGTPKLVDALSKLLSQMIRERYSPTVLSLIVVFLKCTKRFRNGLKQLKNNKLGSRYPFPTTRS